MKTLVTCAITIALFVGDAIADPAAYVRGEWAWRSAGCQSTRTRVLIRDAERAELDAAKCTVAAGAWRDRYTGLLVDDPRALDVDHLVPLRWAHDHGAAAWPPQMKRDYANDLGYRLHLLAVGASANRAKGAKGPAEWRPPDPAAACAYGQAWATVIVTWDLTPDPATRAAIRALVVSC